MPLLFRRPQTTDSPVGTIRPVSTPTSASQRVKALEDQLEHEKEIQEEIKEIEDEKRSSKNLSITQQTRETGDRALEALKKSKDAAEVAMQHPRRYFKNTLLVTSLLFLLNGIFCYVGTGVDSPLVNVGLFYGWVDGEHRHLQKTAGMFCTLISVINFLPYLPQYDNNAFYVFTAFVDAAVILYYTSETFVYWAIRAEVMVTMAFVLVINCAWAMYSYRARKFSRDQRRKELEEALKERELEEKDLEEFIKSDA
mmetsp:Transcript_3702/g.14080  ORF Transcript_3702/g.14080 Transcript_3702/m.14080 type:complete len:254 (-) Transcript_3702:4328-5089(-)